MKKTFLVIALFLSVAGFGQKGLYFGLGGYMGASGVVNQNTYGHPELDYAIPMSLGYHANIGYNFTEHVGLKMELGLSHLGQKYSDLRTDSATGVDTNFARRVKFNYFSIPVLFRYTGGGKVARFYVAAGPQMMLLLTAEQTYTANGEPYERTVMDKDGNPFVVGDKDIKDRISSFDIMARIDMGVDITLVTNLVLNAGITMGYGFLDVNADAYKLEDYSSNYNASHNYYGGFTVGLNYYLPSKK